MNIFGLNITTKQKRMDYIAKHDAEVQELRDEIEELNEEINCMLEEFPFFIGQVVYDVALKNAQGKYTKTKPSFEHSTITEVTVDEKNYFKLVDRLDRNDVFFSREDAEEFLKDICK